MRRHESPSASAHSVSGAVRRGSGPESLWAVNQRLASTERELRIQFTRIAQLQAQLDLVLRTLRRSPGWSPCVMSVGAECATDSGPRSF
jgi:hypothetical protein